VNAREGLEAAIPCDRHQWRIGPGRVARCFALDCGYRVVL